VTTELYGPEFFAGRSETVTESAHIVAGHALRLFQPRSVLDVGCGKGEWLDAFGLNDAVGVDIACPDGDQFVRHDLTEPLNLGRDFDLVVSLETGEHLPPGAAETLVGSIVRHGDRVLFSAAVPGQEGIGQINCQPHEYWHGLFADRGMVVTDPIRPLISHDHRVKPWYRNNMFVYERWSE
jgi:SAM-dependent methyltransferase